MFFVVRAGERRYRVFAEKLTEMPPDTARLVLLDSSGLDSVRPTPTYTDVAALSERPTATLKSDRPPVRPVVSSAVGTACVRLKVSDVPSGDVHSTAPAPKKPGQQTLSTAAGLSRGEPFAVRIFRDHHLIPLILIPRDISRMMVPD